MISSQAVQDFAGFRADVVEHGHMLPLEAVGALAAGEHGRVEGEMAQQVERVGVRLARLRSDAFGFQRSQGHVLCFSNT